MRGPAPASRLRATIGRMNRLESELQRLYRPDADEQVRAMVLELARPASWAELAKVWQGVQADLDLPQPGIAVSGVDGLQLWFSLAQGVPSAEAISFLEFLRRRYLADVPLDRIAIRLATGEPPVEVAQGRWSAFVAPDLAALFAEEPWLDHPPSPDAQADLLARLQSTGPDDWQRAYERLRPAQAEPASAAAPIRDPRRFLLDVMNDTTIEMHLRIEAAKALLPWTEGPPPA